MREFRFHVRGREMLVMSFVVQIYRTPPFLHLPKPARFHQCVRLSKFDVDREITFIPPDEPFQLMTLLPETPVSPETCAKLLVVGGVVWWFKGKPRENHQLLETPPTRQAKPIFELALHLPFSPVTAFVCVTPACLISLPPSSNSQLVFMM